MMYSLATVLTTALRQRERQYGRSRRAAMRKTCETRARRARQKSGFFFARPGRRYQAKRDAPTRCSSFQRRGEADARTTGGRGGGALARDVGVGNKESTSTVTARACNRVRREGLDIRTTPFGGGMSGV